MSSPESNIPSGPDDERHRDKTLVPHVPVRKGTNDAEPPQFHLWIPVLPDTPITPPLAGFYHEQLLLGNFAQFISTIIPQMDDIIERSRQTFYQTSQMSQRTQQGLQRIIRDLKRVQQGLEEQSNAYSHLSTFVLSMLEDGVESLTDDKLRQVAQELQHSASKLNAVNLNTLEQNLEELEEVGTEPIRHDVMTKHVQLYQPLLLQMLLARGVDNYLIYLSELLALIFRTKPKMLKSGEMVTYEMILQYDTMDELIAGLVEERVNALSFKGLGPLIDDISKRFGFNLFDQVDDRERAIRLVDLRNIIVHNRAVVDRKFLARQSEGQVHLGDRVELDVHEVFRELDFLTRSAFDIDKRAADKFKLPQGTPKTE